MITAELAHTFIPGRIPAVVFVHGLGADGRCFAAAPRLLCGGNALLIPDLLGFGRSDAIPAHFSFTMQEQADLVLGLCEAKGLREIAIVGHSMGGAVGILMAQRWAGKVTHFANAVGNLVSEDATYSRHILGQGQQRFSSAGFQRFKREIAKAGKKDRPAGTYLSSLDSTTAQAMYRSSEDLVAWSDHGDLLGRFLRLACRKLYLKDADTPLSAGLRKALAQGGCSIFEVPDAGHGLMEDNPAIFYDAIDSFLKERT